MKCLGPEINTRMPPTDYIIQRLQNSGWVLMSAFVDRDGLYDLTFHRWNNGKVFSVSSAESWRDAICNAYAQWQRKEKQVNLENMLPVAESVTHARTDRKNKPKAVQPMRDRGCCRCKPCQGA